MLTQKEKKRMTIWYDHEMTEHTTLLVSIAFVGVI